MLYCFLIPLDPHIMQIHELTPRARPSQTRMVLSPNMALCRDALNVSSWQVRIVPADLYDDFSIAMMSALGCWKRHQRGTLWWFRLESGYISPNTSVLSQACFALYSICE